MYTALLYMGCSLLYCIQNLRLDLLCCIGLYACLANIKFVSFVSKIALWPIHLHLSFPGCPPTEIILFFFICRLYYSVFFVVCIIPLFCMAIWWIYYNQSPCISFITWHACILFMELWHNQTVWKLNNFSFDRCRIFLEMITEKRIKALTQKR